MTKKPGKKVFVGLSGGVDSSVAAAILKDQGYDVVGVFIKTWQPEFLECTSSDDRRDAMRVCAILNIPFILFDAEESYKAQVIDYMISEYAKGRTPNPDLMCNKYVKFGVFYDFAIKNGADFVATGHYAKTLQGHLYRAVDSSKDQSYFLSSLTKEKLENTLFPIGNLLKSEVRKMAEKYSLFTSNKKDSQGLCFIGKIPMKDFLKEMLKQEGYVLDSGKVLNEIGEVIGEHNGAMLYTIGERHGFTIFKQTPNAIPLYVLDKNIEKNTITVGCRNVTVLMETIILDSVNIIEKDFFDNANINENLIMQYRYHGEFVPVILENKEGRWTLKLKKKLGDIALGQAAVIYKGELCIGSGIIAGVTQ